MGADPQDRPGRFERLMGCIMVRSKRPVFGSYSREVRIAAHGVIRDQMVV